MKYVLRKIFSYCEFLYENKASVVKVKKKSVIRFHTYVTRVRLIWGKSSKKAKPLKSVKKWVEVQYKNVLNKVFLGERMTVTPFLIGTGDFTLWGGILFEHGRTPLCSMDAGSWQNTTPCYRKVLCFQCVNSRFRNR